MENEMKNLGETKKSDLKGSIKLKLKFKGALPKKGVDLLKIAQKLSSRKVAK